MRYQTSLALLTSAVSIVARPTSGSALNSVLQKKEDKCFCFQISDPEKTDVKCGRYIIPKSDDKDCDTFKTASSRRCCDNGCNEHGCDQPGGLSFGYSADEIGPHNSMNDTHGDLVASEWKKATDTALGPHTKTTDKKSEKDKEEKNKEDSQKKDDSDSDSDDEEGEDEDD